jgi:hypothetical protein
VEEAGDGDDAGDLLQTRAADAEVGDVTFIKTIV